MRSDHLTEQSGTRLSHRPRKLAVLMKGGAVAGAAAFAFGAAVPCVAQVLLPSATPRSLPHRYIAVAERIQPDSTARGITLGAYTLYPRIDGTVTYTDNVFATRTNQDPALFLRIEPRLVANYSDGNVRASAYALGTIDRYTTNLTENSEQWNVGTNALATVSDTTQVGFGVQWKRSVESRRSQDVFTLTRQPVRYSTLSTGAVVSQSFDRLKLEMTGTLAETSFSDARLADGTPLDLASRESRTGRVRVRAGLDYSSAVNVFVQGSYNARDFFRPNGSLPERDSTGWELLVGARFEPVVPLRGEIGVGYVKQSFRSDIYGDFSGLAMNGRVQVFPTDLTTITVTTDRSIYDSGIPGVAGFLATTVSVGVDHELLRQLILSAVIDYERDRFNGTLRRDTRWTGELAARYAFSRQIGLIARYNRLTVSSNIGARQFTDNRLTLGTFFRI